ncbi:MAG: TetR/AcrR family transcriptional regulator [Streptosporangiaceae bacterium]
MVANAPATSYERIVDAAEECFARFGVAKTTVEDVALSAGMSRATLYRNFGGGRDELILAVFLRDVSRFFDQITERLTGQLDVPAAVVDGIVDAVVFIRHEPRIAGLLAPEVVGHTQTVVNQASERVLRLCADRVRPYFSLAQEAGLLRPGTEVEGAVEFLFRIIASLSLSPLTRTDEETRHFLRTYVLPSLIA